MHAHAFVLWQTPDSPYIVMFGPDKCGDTNKVHFILRHQNPVSKEWEEKHFKSDTPVRPTLTPHAPRRPTPASLRC